MATGETTLGELAYISQKYDHSFFIRDQTVAVIIGDSTYICFPDTHNSVIYNNATLYKTQYFPENIPDDTREWIMLKMTDNEREYIRQTLNTYYRTFRESWMHIPLIDKKTNEQKIRYVLQQMSQYSQPDYFTPKRKATSRYIL